MGEGSVFVLDESRDVREQSFGLEGADVTIRYGTCLDGTSEIAVVNATKGSISIDKTVVTTHRIEPSPERITAHRSHVSKAIHQALRDVRYAAINGKLID